MNELTAVEVRSQVQLIQQVMKSVMKKDTHYGTIPGCKRPTLYKAGSEKILATFRLSIEPQVEDLSTDDVAKYRVTTKVVHIPTGNFVGMGIGCCSSDEEKYKWRRAVCDAEFDETPEDRRREKWVKGYNGKEDYKVKQVRTSVADIDNTVLKMAKKRSQIDATLTSTAASDVFEQDLEDIPSEIINSETPPQETKPDVEPPKAKSEGGFISDPQIKRLIAIARGSGHSVEDVDQYIAKTYGLNSKSEISWKDGQYDSIVDHFKIQKGA